MYTDQIHTTVAEKYNIMLRWLSDIHHFHKGNKGAILAEEELFLKEVRQVEDVSNSRVFIIAHRMLVSNHVTYKLSEAVKKLLKDLHITVLMLADVSSHVVRSQELLPRLFFHIQHNPLADFEGDTMSKRLLALGQKIKKEDKIHGWDWGDEGLEVKILTEDGDGDDEPLKRWEAESYVASSLDDNDHWRPMIETFMASTLATLKVTNITKKKKALWELTFSDKTTVDMKERWIRDCGYPAWIAALETAKTSEGKDENEGEDEKKGEETGEDESEELHQAREEAEAARREAEAARQAVEEAQQKTDAARRKTADLQQQLKEVKKKLDEATNQLKRKRTRGEEDIIIYKRLKAQITDEVAFKDLCIKLKVKEPKSEKKTEEKAEEKAEVKAQHPAAEKAEEKSPLSPSSPTSPPPSSPPLPSPRRRIKNKTYRLPRPLSPSSQPSAPLSSPQQHPTAEEKEEKRSHSSEEEANGHSQ